MCYRISVLRVLTVAACVLAASLGAGEDDPYIAIAKNVETWAAKNDVAAIDGVIDVTELLQRIKGTTPVDPKAFQAFSTGFKRGAVKLSANLCEWAQVGQFNYMRLRPDGTYRIALFRMHGAMGVNYQELLMQRRPDGTIKIVDLKAQNTGEYFSDLLRPLLLSALQKENPSLFNRIFGGKPTILDAMPKLQQMKQAIGNEDFDGALRIYDSIPAEQKSWKPAYLLRISAAAKLDEKTWLKAIDDFEKAYPGDTAVKFQMIDAHLLRKNYKASLEAVDALDKAIGGDVFLNVLRANIHKDMGKPAEGEALAQKAVDGLPPFDEAYTALLLCQIANKKYAAAVKTLDKFNEHFEGINGEFLTSEPSCAEFIQSPEFKNWKAAQK